MTHHPRTAVFPVAGRGTRMRPATLTIPKELLPVVDTPLIDFAIDEAIEAGCERLVFVTSPDKPMIRPHVLARCAHRAEICFVDQDKPLGLGHAVLCAAPDVLPGPVAVILPDDLILGSPYCLTEMTHLANVSGHLVATMPVLRSEVSRYGILSARHGTGPLIPARTLVEKPQPDAAPSTLAVVGRYLLDPAIFDALSDTRPGSGGEVQLTDAIAATAGDVGLTGVMFSGQRFDCGSKEGLLAATLARAGSNPVFARVLADQGLAAHAA